MQTALPEPVMRSVEESVRVRAHDLGIIDAQAIAVEIRHRFPDESVRIDDIRASVIAVAGKRGVTIQLD